MATLWSGQMSLVVGLLPLTGGYLLFTRDRAFLAGLVWSFLSLKPQFVFVPAVVILALAFARRFECCAGFIVGVVGLIVSNIIFVPMAITISWLHSLQLGDALFSSGVYKIRDYLITSLPANILLILPVGLRPTVHWYVCTAAATLWLVGTWHCKKLVNSSLHAFSKISLILIVALFLLPIASPYLLYYDLCILLPAGVILLGNEWPPSSSASLKLIAFIGWISISSYMLVFMTIQAHLVQPLLLQLILLGLFAKLLKTTDRICIVSKAP